MSFPTAQQKAVIESTAHDILVEAGAGSGKTSTMVERYIHLIGSRGFEASEILAFTFTDKAAGELREKVRTKRQEFATRPEANDPQTISMSDAWVGTFHAICNRILKAWPIEAGIDPRFGVIDDVTAETVRNAAFQDALTEFRDEANDPATRELMVATLTERTLRGTTISAYDELRSRGVRNPVLPDFPDTPYPEAEIRQLAGVVPGLRESGVGTKSQRDKLEAIHELLDAEMRCEDLAPHKFTSVKEEFSEVCDLIPKVIAKLAAHEFGDRFRRDLGRLLELFGQRYTREKERRSVLDYEDLQLLTVKLLTDHPRIRDAYRSRFREIMVDEFQDTNRLQLDLVALLRGEETSLITVGDEMQSIYGFRHAEVELFRSRRDEDGVVSYRLTDNFRSQPQVIAAVNLIGGQLDRQASTLRETGPAGRHRFAELTIGLEADREASVEIAMTERPGWKSLDLGPLAPAIAEEAQVGKDEDHFYEAEALALAHRLKGLIESGKAQQKDIAILLRARTRAGLYVGALRHVGLDPYLSGGTGFWATREAADLRALLSVVANPLDDESLLTVLTSPICGLSADALWILGRAESSTLWDALIAAGNADTPGLPAPVAETDVQLARNLVGLVGELRGIAGTSSLAVLVDEASRRSGYDLASLTADRTGNGLAAVRRISSLAREYEDAEGRSLRGFLDWVSLSADLDSESAVATAEEESDVIRIMTVHAAKGLEFPVVCVPDCGRSTVNRHNFPLLLGRPGSGPEGSDPATDFAVGLRLKLADGKNVELYDWPGLKSESGSRLEDEELRLFHVALTRAQERLIISGVPPKNFPKKSQSQSRSMILRLCETFGLDPEEMDSWPPGLGEEGEETIIDLSINRANEETAAKLAEAGKPRERAVSLTLAPPPLARPRFEVFPNIPLSFTALTEFAECPARFYARRVLGLQGPDEPAGARTTGDPVAESVTERDRATRFGIAVHEILESLGRSRWPDARPERISEALERNGITTPEDAERAARMVRGFVESPLGRRLRDGEATFEVPLLLRVENVTIRGFVDVLLEGDPPLILDYKTNRLDGTAPQEKMETYGVQRDLYALALSRARDVEQVSTAFVFLEDAWNPAEDRLTADDLAAAEDGLRGYLKEIVEGRFFGGPESARQPCGECWACRRLARQLAQAA